MRDWRLAIIVLGVLVLLLLIVLAFALRRYRALHAELREPEVRDLREPIVIISDPGEDLDDGGTRARARASAHRAVPRARSCALPPARRSPLAANPPRRAAPRRAQRWPSSWRAFSRTRA